MERRGFSVVMQSVRPAGFGIALLTCALLLACRSPGPASDAPRSRAADPASGEFSAESAWQHLQALNQFGSRVSGSTGSARARQYLRGILGRLDIELREQRVSVVVESGKSVELTHVTATIPGRSSDILLLAAHYDTSPEAMAALRHDDQRASGPALLLELTRALHAGPTPEYTVWLSWIDGDALQATPRNGPSQVRLGTQSLVDEWSRGEEFSRIRAAVFFGNVGARDRPIVRDIDSPRVYRETFWQVARELGYGDAFPADSRYGLSSTGQLTFARAALRSSIALANLRDRDGESSEESSEVSQRKQTAQGSPGPAAGFEAVGNVTLEALIRIAGKLRKVDRFARSPLSAGRAETAERSHAD